MTVQAAFFIGPGTLADRLIRWRTSSPASHVELWVEGESFTSYPGIGVRKVSVASLADRQWEVVPLPWVTPEHVRAFFDQTEGAPYDWLGVIAGQTLSAKIRRKGDFFCSEWCAAALGFAEAWRYSPGLLLALLPRLEKQV